MTTDSHPLPLEGIKVIELGTLIAGPYAASLLAQRQADLFGDGSIFRGIAEKNPHVLSLHDASGKSARLPAGPHTRSASAAIGSTRRGRTLVAFARRNP